MNDGKTRFTNLEGFALIQRLLFDGDKPIQLATQIFEARLLLIENSGRALGKEEMLQQIWAD